MTLTFAAILAATALMFGTLAAHEAGRRIGVLRRRRGSEDEGAPAGAVSAAVFGLLGLLLAFTFSGAAARFEARRHLITTEANAIGTAYLRLDLLPAEAQPALRNLFRDYLETRIDAHSEGGDSSGAARRQAAAGMLQRRIWDGAVAGSTGPALPASTRQLLLPALNEMIDITTTRSVATVNHPPPIILGLLVGLCLLGSALIGHSAAAASRRGWFYPGVFAVTMALTFYVVIDLEYPRQGLIRIDDADKTLSALRATIH